MSKLLVLIALSSGASAMRDVPLGECHMCEVTCFEDCSLKYNREIMQDDDFLQLPSKNQTSNRTAHTKIGQEFAQCLQDEKCPCPKEEAKAAANATGFLQTKNATCVVNSPAADCAVKCGQKVADKSHAALDAKKAKAPEKKKAVLLQRDYPIHSVHVGVFSKGHMNLAECHKFCLAATCGCDKTPGLGSIDKLFKAIKANDAAEPGEKDFSHRGEKNNQHGGGVVDTHASKQYAPAKIEECAKGMLGKKVNKGLYVDFGGGVGGEVEICSKEMFLKVFGPGDHSKKKKLCASSKQDGYKWGCIWNEEKSYCGVGFSPNLRCQKKFIRDPSRL